MEWVERGGRGVTFASEASVKRREHAAQGSVGLTEKALLTISVRLQKREKQRPEKEKVWPQKISRLNVRGILKFRLGEKSRFLGVGRLKSRLMHVNGACKLYIHYARAKGAIEKKPERFGHVHSKFL